MYGLTSRTERESSGDKGRLRGHFYQLTLLILPPSTQLHSLINFHELNMRDQYPDQNTEHFQHSQTSTCTVLVTTPTLNSTCSPDFQRCRSLCLVLCINGFVRYASFVSGFILCYVYDPSCQMGFLFYLPSK